MTIYYNPTYSSAPYRNTASGAEFGSFYCGDNQLLQRLLFYAGIPYAPATNEERMAHYHACMQRKVDAASPFYASFKTDSAGMTRAVLAWRDALVGAGWLINEYAGVSPKLSLVRDVESEDMPKGEADYWLELMQLAVEGRILPADINVVVTCSVGDIKPHIAYILSEQSKRGVVVEFRPIVKAVAKGNLGRIQSAVLSGTDEKISLDNSDDTFCYMRFATEDDALRYVATEPVDKSAVYYCSNTKRFDNTLKLLGKPTIGSSLSLSSPQVAQLFVVGNGLFEYPLNIRRIIEWLNMPIGPVDKGLCRVLSQALIDSGGVNNARWNKAKDEYLNSVTDLDKRKDIAQQYDDFLPISQCDVVDVEKVKAFNSNLRKWANNRLAMDKFPYEAIVREQIASVQSYCAALLKMLESAPVDFRFLDLQLWCRNIAQPSAYGQYEAEITSHNTISVMGDLHDAAAKVVWFPAADEGVVSYPFEMFNDAEYDEAASGGAKLYKRDQHSLINQTAMLRMLLNAERLTIIEADKCNGEKVARHPLVLQLNERIEGGLKSIAVTPTISKECITTDSLVNNKSEKEFVLQLVDGVELKERHLRATDEKGKTESYSSISQLIQHPFTYVCEKCAKLKDHAMPSAQDLERTLGNVAHLMIEKVFGGRTLNEAAAYYAAEYDAIFEESVNQTGLLLRLPEYAIELRRLKRKMKDALRILYETISENDLTVEACEYDFKQAQWSAAGDGVILSSRADMLLSSADGKVIFDFKYTTSKRRQTEIEENRTLQLELYRYMARQEFGENTPVRVAYVLLPDVTILTADRFYGVTAIPLKDTRKNADVMNEAANSYRLRWEQFKAGVIERVEGADVGTGQYAELRTARQLFPLEEYKKKYEQDRFNKDYKNLK